MRALAAVSTLFDATEWADFRADCNIVYSNLRSMREGEECQGMCKKCSVYE